MPLPLRVVIAPDKFKGSLSAVEVAQAMSRGVRNALGARSLGNQFEIEFAIEIEIEIEIDEAPLADGGEGTVEALVAATSGTYQEANVTGPLGEPRTARFGLLGDGQTAVLEMAAASGLVLVPQDRRDPRSTTTRGTGELLRAAIEAGAWRIIIGIGGSATNDGGAGLAQALGYRLLDAKGAELPPGGGSLDQLERIDHAQHFPGLETVEIAVACDVDNPLCGPKGASAIYGPQKGATPEIVEQLDRNLDHLAKIIERDLGVSVRDIPGAGAAGGLGAGLVAFAGGRLERGIDLVLEAVGMAQRLKGADLCLTGEGAIDASTAFGKTAVGVARLAKSLGCPTIALAGTIGEGAEAVLEQGIDAYLSIAPGPITLEEAIAQAPQLLEQATGQALRIFLAGRHRAQ